MSNKAIFERFAVTDSGDVIPGAEYTVVNESTGTDLTIYSSREGASKSPPYFADSSGLMQFYVDAGTTFRVVVTGPTGSFASRYNQGLLLIESPTDTTDGRVMTTGAGGLLGVSPSFSGDLDTLTKFQSVTTSTSTTNRPPFGSSNWHIISSEFSSSAATQFAQDYVNNICAIRHKVSNVWSSWQELYHTGNLNYAQNTSGSTRASNATVSGSGLTPAQTGTWRNASGGDILNNGYGLWVVV